MRLSVRFGQHAGKLNRAVCLQAIVSALVPMAGLSFSVGCVSSEPSLDSPAPLSRARALARIDSDEDSSAVHGLIQALASEDPAERLIAANRLIELTGDDLGYEHAGTLEDRRDAIRRWREWYGTRYGGLAEETPRLEPSDGGTMP